MKDEGEILVTGQTTTVAVAVARAIGDIEAFVNLSQMT